MGWSIFHQMQLTGQCRFNTREIGMPIIATFNRVCARSPVSHCKSRVPLFNRFPAESPTMFQPEPVTHAVSAVKLTHTQSYPPIFLNRPFIGLFTQKLPKVWSAPFLQRVRVRVCHSFNSTLGTRTFWLIHCVRVALFEPFTAPAVSVHANTGVLDVEYRCLGNSSMKIGGIVGFR